MTSIATKRSVPYFDYPKSFTAREDELMAVMRDVLRRGAFIGQRDLLDFEQRLAEYVGVKHAIGLGNATDGLHLAWRAAGLEPMRPWREALASAVAGRVFATT